MTNSTCLPKPGAWNSHKTRNNVKINLLLTQYDFILYSSDRVRQTGALKFGNLTDYYHISCCWRETKIKTVPSLLN